MGTQAHELLERVERLERELEQLKRDLIQNLAITAEPSRPQKPSLFGSVRGGDISEEHIEEAKRNLFRGI
ncbi:MAG: hypothetical protein ACE5JP_03475 [Candidatus Bipolaricaulia bacterium]